MRGRSSGRPSVWESVRARQPRLLSWLQKAQPDVVCLQELKVTDESFPYEAIQQAGYHAAVYGQ